MSNFRTRLLGLTAMATAFVGVSFGQALTCTDSVANANNPAIGSTQPQVNAALRVESQTDQLSLLQFACTGTSTPVGTTTVTVTIFTNLPITSKAITGGTEATLIANGTVSNASGSAGNVTVVAPAGSTGPATAVQGVVSGSTVTFAGITIPTGPAGITTYFQVANIRVNASAATTVPFQTSESGLIAYTTSTTSGTTTAFATIPATGSSGLVVPSLNPPTVTGIAAAATVCTGNSTQSFQLNINTAKVSGAFLEAGTAPGVGQPPVGEGGQYLPGAPSAIGTANADVITVTYSGLPSGGTVYVPATISSMPAGPNSTTLTTTGTVAPAGFPVGDVGFAVPSTGIVTIPYTVTTFSLLGAPAQSSFPVATIVAFAANSTNTATTVTATYNYSPQGATLTGPATTVPTFSNVTPPAVNASSIVLCQTTLLFPFVTNQVGFDTGIAIANTSVDNLAAGFKSFATAQPASATGPAAATTCNLFFYGPFAPTVPAATPFIPDPQGALVAGTTHAFQLSSVAPGYQGYMIAVCPFNYAHAFAFLTYGLTQTNGVAEGYLAEVLGTGDRNQSIASGDGAITF
jgi:hypothetical protein